ncbi:MAG TPA: YggT family protein [Anaerolineales bacterium]|jgi:YggT family protein
MDLLIVARIVQMIAQILIWTVFASALLSFILAPYHPVREALDRILEPMLAPIRRILPATGMFDFSPLVLVIMIALVSGLLVTILRSL